MNATGAHTTRGASVKGIARRMPPFAVAVAVAVAVEDASTIDASGSGVYRITVGGNAGASVLRRPAMAGAPGKPRTRVAAESIAAARMAVRTRWLVIRTWACGIGNSRYVV